MNKNCEKSVLLIKFGTACKYSRNRKYKKSKQELYVKKNSKAFNIIFGDCACTLRFARIF